MNPTPMAFRSTVHGNLTEPDVWVADDLDDAMLGVGTQAGHRVAVYDLEACLTIYMTRDGMTRDEAVEYLYHNVIGSNLGHQTPVFLERGDDP